MMGRIVHKWFNIQTPLRVLQVGCIWIKGWVRTVALTVARAGYIIGGRRECVERLGQEARMAVGDLEECLEG
jgi:hypothetical protein